MTDFQEVISTEPLEGDITQPILQNPTAEDECYKPELEEHAVSWDSNRLLHQ